MTSSQSAGWKSSFSSSPDPVVVISHDHRFLEAKTAERGYETYLGYFSQDPRDHLGLARGEGRGYVRGRLGLVLLGGRRRGEADRRALGG